MSKEINTGYQTELLKNLSGAFNVESSQNNENIAQAAELIKNGYYPILISNHQSHADGIPHAFISRKIIVQSDRQLNGFYLPIAASIETGHQGHDLQKLIIDQKPLLANFGLHMIPVTREKDIVEYSIPTNIESIKKIIKSPQDRFGFVFLPEGNVQGGRINPETGQIYGISRPKNLGALDLVIRGCHKDGKDFFFLPVGINGSYKIVSPDHNKNGNQIDEFKTEKIMNFIKVENKADIIIGSPIMSQEYVKFIDKIDGLMLNVAKLLPVEAQGFYSSNSRKDLNQL